MGRMAKRKPMSSQCVHDGESTPSIRSHDFNLSHYDTLRIMPNVHINLSHTFYPEEEEVKLDDSISSSSRLSNMSVSKIPKAIFTPQRSKF